MKIFTILVVAVFLGACAHSQKNKLAKAHKPKRFVSSSKSFEKAVKHIIAAEGGYSSKENDATGEVRYGITGTTAKRYGYKGKMKKLPMSTAKRIYKRYYWDKLPKNLSGKAKFVLFDASVNQGPGYARKLAIQSKGNVKKMIQLRRNRYRMTAKKKPELKKFLKGWMNRLNKVEKLVKTNKV